MDDWSDRVLGVKHQYYQKNRGQISTGKILSHGSCDPIIMYIPTMGDELY